MPLAGQIEERLVGRDFLGAPLGFDHAASGTHIGEAEFGQDASLPVVEGIDRVVIERIVRAFWRDPLPSGVGQVDRLPEQALRHRQGAAERRLEGMP